MVKLSQMWHFCGSCYNSLHKVILFLKEILFVINSFNFSMKINNNFCSRYICLSINRGNNRGVILKSIQSWFFCTTKDHKSPLFGTHRSAMSIKEQHMVGVELSSTINWCLSTLNECNVHLSTNAYIYRHPKRGLSLIHL